MVRPETIQGETNNNLLLARVEAGTNTSTVALRVVGGDEKGDLCLGV
jgi:hypothetical protein